MGTMRLKRVGVLSCAIVAGLLYGLMGLLIGGIFSLVSLLGLVAGIGQGTAEEAVWGLMFGIGAVVFLPVFYGGIGFVGTAVGAALYNLIAKITGGIVLELQ